MRYMLEVPQNCDEVGVLEKGKRYPAELLETCPWGRYFSFKVAGMGADLACCEFDSAHLSGGGWIVHEEDE